MTPPTIRDGRVVDKVIVKRIYVVQEETNWRNQKEDWGSKIFSTVEVLLRRGVGVFYHLTEELETIVPLAGEEIFY